MTIELFSLDPYCSSFEAQVVGVGRGYVLLDQTHFFAKSAEQSSDTGRIDGMDVIGASRYNGDIRHVVEYSGAFAVGDLVHCELDWTRRYNTMRLHTAQHLVQLAVQATHDLGSLVGGEIGPRRATIDFLPHDSHSSLEVDAIERWVKSVVAQRVVAAHETDASLDRRRHWHLDGVGTITCAGTHVRCTGEVGAVGIAIVGTDNATIRIGVELTGD